MSHSHAVSLTLPVFIEAHADADPARLQDRVAPATHQAAMATVLAKLGASDGADARHRFTQLLGRIDLPATLGGVGVAGRDEVEALVDSANLERLGNNPMRLDRDTLLGLIAIT